MRTRRGYRARSGCARLPAHRRARGQRLGVLLRFALGLPHRLLAPGRGTIRSPAILLPLLLTCFVCANAEEEPPPRTERTAKTVAAEIVRAIDAGDERALELLAMQVDPDPWLVAEQLLAGGARDAALRFARKGSGPAVDGLAVHLESVQHAPERRTVVAEAQALERAGKVEEALAALGMPSEAPRDVVGVLGEFFRGRYLKKARRLRASGAAYARAAEGAEAIGWRTQASSAFYEAGLSYFARGDYAAALRLFRRRLVVEERLESEMGRGRAHFGIAACLNKLGKLEEAASHGASAQRLATASGDALYLAKLLIEDAVASAHREATEEALALSERAAEALRAIDVDRFPARFPVDPMKHAEALINALTNCSSMAAKLHEDEQARHYAREAARLARRSKNPTLIDEAGAALARLNGVVHYNAQRLLQALTQYSRAEALYKRLGYRDARADVLSRLAFVHADLGNLPSAHESVREAIRILKASGAKRALAQAYLSAASVATDLGDFRAAEAYYLQALRIFERLDELDGRIRATVGLGGVARLRTEYARSLEFLHRALTLHTAQGRRGDRVPVLMALCHTHQSLGDYETALEHAEAALALIDTGKSAISRESARGQIALLLRLSGRPKEAVVVLEELVRLHLERADRSRAAQFLSRLGDAQMEADFEESAARSYERAIGLDISLGDREAEVFNRVRRASVLLWLRRPDIALEELTYAHEQASELNDDSLHAMALAGLAEFHYVQDAFAKSMAYAREGCEIVARTGLDRPEAEMAVLRAGFEALPRWGIAAAVAAGDDSALYEFLERGRSGALVASLGGREILRETQVPAELRAAEARAKADATMAYHRFEEARQSTAKLDVIRKRRQEMERARARHWDTVAASQRAVRSQADLTYPSIPALATTQAGLTNDEALVIYGRTGWIYIALVITRKTVRRIDLGKEPTLKPLLKALIGEPGNDPALAAVHEKFLAPLALDKRFSRLLIAPAGLLSYVPFAALEPKRAIALLPSATALQVLRETMRGAGTKILAVGDPSYSGRPPPSGAVKGLLRGRGLVPLPQTRVEVNAIGDEILLGREASETGFLKALALQPHWRAVHLACHGLVDDVLPTRSALVLTHDAENDGYLYASEILAKVPLSADLVVLSACETGRGRVYEGEGLVGLSRAFMLAGTPRVIASLWKVDDEATQALMRKFYRLWSPKNGPGIDAAEALRQAQAFVRGQKQWEDARYWAAWVLWGLP